MPVCPRCGAENPERARFCLECGAPLRAPAKREARKLVTVLFCDVTGSTALAERLEPESLNQVMARWFEAARAVLERHGGTVQKFIGDAVMAVFGIPLTHEDDALRAVRAGADLGSALDALNAGLERDWGVRLQVRTGVNTGEVVVGNPAVGDALVLGDAVNVAARLEQAAEPDHLLLGPATYALVRHAVEVAELEPLTLKGKRAPVAAVRLVSVRSDARSGPVGIHTPLVGRADETRAIDLAYERAVASSSCHLLTVLGGAGVGKSRLVGEALAGRVTEARLLTGRCLPYGEGITFWPIAEIVRRAARIVAADTPAQARAKLAELVAADPDAERITTAVSGLIGLTEVTALPEEAAWSVRRLLEALAAERPLIVVLDDLHWAEPTLLDLVEYITDSSHTVPILLLVIARPELLEERPAWAGGKPNATSILLEPLAAEESEEMIGYLTGPDPLAGDVRGQITRVAGGNPLFLQEIFGLLVDTGQLRQDDGRWVAASELATISMPPTIHALLGARLDHLDIDSRSVLERASVVGQEFERLAVEELVPDELRPAISDCLDSLVRKELLRPASSRLTDGQAFQFRHLLIRDAAYDTLPKQARSELHERFAGWVERHVGERVREYEEIIGHHLEQAWRYRVELGPPDEAARALAARAAERLAAAGNRAFARADMVAAASLLGRGTTLLRDTDPLRLRLLPNLARALTDRGQFAEAEAVLDEAAKLATAAGDAGLEAHARLGQFWLYSFASADDWLEEAERGAEQLIPVLEERSDHAGLAKAWRLLAEVHQSRCHTSASEAAAQRAVEHATLAGEEQELASSLGALGVSGMWGRTPAAEAIRRTEAILEQARGRPSAEAATLKGLAALRAMTGDFAEARELMARSLAILEEIGRKVVLAGSAQTAGYVELLAGDPVAAERALRRGYDLLEALGDRAYVANVAALLAHALVAQGRYEEAGRAVETARELTTGHDIDTQFHWRTAEARVLTAAGRAGEAEDLALAAAGLVAGTDELNLQGDARVVLAEAVRAAGRPDEAAAHLAEAVARYREKGNLVSAGRAEAALRELAPPGA
jgi:predicted ATPase/class 3 adenylate cyclase